MDKLNPAWFECPETKSGIHYWKLREDHTSYCLKCKLELTKEQTYDVWQENP